MKARKLITVLFFAAVTMTAMADVPSPKYYYHAVPQSVFNEWHEHKKSVNAVPTDSDWRNWLVEVKTTARERKETFRFLGISVIVAISSLMIVISMNMVFLQRRRYKLALLYFLGGTALLLGVVFWGKPVIVSEIDFAEVAMSGAGGGGDITVKPNDGESYDQYTTRVYRKAHDLCEVCGTKMEHWYKFGRHTGCPKCNKFKCAKDVQKLFSDAEVKSSDDER